MSRGVKAAVAAVVVVLLAIPGVPWLLGIRRVEPGAAPMEVSAEYPHDVLDVLLSRFVSRDGAVDYAALAQDSVDLRRYVATIGTVGPGSRPDLFPTDAHRFAWHINAYNAVTLLGIVDSWPNAGVHDIHGPLNPKPGFGFFFGLRFQFDGLWLHTYGFENDVMRGSFKDARLHAAINCASKSCPRLRTNAYLPDLLEEQLDRAAREFVSTPPHVVFDSDARVVKLSRIFQWFRGDFEDHVRDLGVGDSVVHFIEHYSYPSRKVEANRARTEDWKITYTEYDWGLNGVTGPPPAP